MPALNQVVGNVRTVRDRKADCDPWGFPGKMQKECTLVLQKCTPLDGWLADLIERTARETAEQTAQRTVEKVKQRCAPKPDRQCNAGQAALLLGYSKPDGSPNCQPSRCTESGTRTLPTLGGRSEPLVLATLGHRGMDQGSPARRKGGRRMTGQATQTPDSENARRCDRRAFSSAAISRGRQNDASTGLRHDQVCAL